MEKLNQIKQKLEEAQQLMKQQGKAALEEAFTSFFDKHPEAKALVWVQYTPYFNDGEPCEFRVNGMELKVDASSMAEDVRKLLGTEAEETQGSEDEDEEHNYGYGDSCAAAVLRELSGTGPQYNWDLCVRTNTTRRSLNDSEKSLLEDFKDLSSALNKLDDLLETVIGDHVKVVVTRDGIQTTDWDHD